MTGCDQLSFNPSLYAQPTTTETDSASGIDVNLSVPQQQSPTIPSPTELRGATVTLPAGFSINPNAADGKTACSDAEARTSAPTEAANCPEFSKVGSLEIDSSALPGPLPGFVYLGEPLPGNRYRIFLVADGFATHVKLAGTVTPDPVTGQLVITFTNLPQSPLTAFNMHFFGSERGLLATPTQCGTYPVTSTFTPWDSSLATQTSTQFFTLDSGPNGSPLPDGPRPFNPGFAGGLRRQHRRRPQPLLARPDPGRRRPEPHRPQRHHPARLQRHPGRHPLLLRGGARRSGRPQLLRPRRAGQPELPRRLADRHRRRRRRRRHPPRSTSRARSTSPAPTKAPRSASR